MSGWQKKIIKFIEVLKTDGVAGIARSFNYLTEKKHERKRYQKWAAIEQEQFFADKGSLLSSIETFSHKPLISIVLPVYNVDEKWLRICIESVICQLYSNLELCIADDASPSPHVKKVLDEYAAKDVRIKVVYRPENGHISAASNSALELVTGEWTVLLDHDDELSPDALFYVAKEINDNPDARLIYSDEDLIDEKGARFDPKFKPDWSPDLFLSLNLVTHLSAFRTELLRTIGGFRIGFEGSQDYDLTLRAIEQIPDSQIRHIPRILYHWRTLETSVALNPAAKSYAHERARMAIRQHLDRTGVAATVSESYPPLHRVMYDLPSETKLSVICAGDKDQAETFLKKSGSANVELIIAAPGAAGLNTAAANAAGDVLIFLESGIKTVSENWLREISSFAMRPEVGAVGAKLQYSNNIIHSGGLIIGIDGTIGFAYRGSPSFYLDSMMRAQVIGNFSAVSGACMATRKDVFESAGGFDAENFPDGSYDVDYCLKLREKDFRIVWTPHALLVKDDKTVTEKIIENKNSPEVKKFIAKWKPVIESDPYFSPNLSRTSESFSVDI
jgi:GT2 family glycosyltransferase